MSRAGGTGCPTQQGCVPCTRSLWPHPGTPVLGGSGGTGFLRIRQDTADASLPLLPGRVPSPWRGCKGPSPGVGPRGLCPPGLWLRESRASRSHCPRPPGEDRDPEAGPGEALRCQPHPPISHRYLPRLGVHRAGAGESPLHQAAPADRRPAQRPPGRLPPLLLRPVASAAACRALSCAKS